MKVTIMVVKKAIPGLLIKSDSELLTKIIDKNIP